MDSLDIVIVSICTEIKDECEWSSWGDCNVTCIHGGSVPETAIGTKKRVVKIEGLKCNGSAEQECQKECPGLLIHGFY